MQWQPDDSVLPDEVRAALESREESSNASQSTPAATANQQQVFGLAVCCQIHGIQKTCFLCPAFAAILVGKKFAL